jgi:2-oxoglutarate dehydrogenase complex dehydrogenase (E1) component-like enzyme
LAEYPAQIKINTKDGERMLEKIYFTELGHVMAKIYDPKSKTWLNKRIGNLNSMLDNQGIQIKEFISLKPSTIQKLGK